MASVRRRRSWEIPERLATPEGVWRERRRFLRVAGAAALVAAVGPSGCGVESRRETAAAGGFRGPAGPAPPPLAPPGPTDPALGSPARDLYPAARVDRFPLDRPLTEERVAATTNNYYEFTEAKGRVWTLARDFSVSPWTLEIAGLVAHPGTLDIDTLIRRHSLEERLYRHRCVEAWAMAVPWTGFPLRDLLRRAGPRPEARFVRFVSFHDPAAAPGQREGRYPWPYYEALTLAEAMHELTFLATGIYGHPLPAAHGAPLRLVVPWKYGFKSIKGIVRLEVVAKRPGTFWSDLVPHEYDFQANVDPATPHPRWSQATERLLGSGERRPTLPFNGYAAEVAALYAG